MHGENHFGSDLVVSLIEKSGIEYFTCTPGATFRGIHDSIVQGDNDLKLLTTPTEGFSVAMAHGYAKATGKMMAVGLHNIVGLQQASMSIFNAWCDRVPILLVGATGPVSKARRRPWIDWIHTALTQGQIVRDYVKWDDQPSTIHDVPESFGRAITTALTSPRGPVYVCLDVDIQEDPIEASDFTEAVRENFPVPSDPSPNGEEITNFLKSYSKSRRPVIVTDFAGETESGFKDLLALAQAHQIPVVDGPSRFSFPSQHYLNASFLPNVIAEADLIIAIDVTDVYATLFEALFSKADGKDAARDLPEIVHFTTGHYKNRSWSHEYGRLIASVKTISSSASEALRVLLEQMLAPSDQVLQDRKAWAKSHTEVAQKEWKRSAENSSKEVDGISGVLLADAIGKEISDLKWVLTNGSLDGWERKLWPFVDFRHHLGWHGGAGLGYGLGASAGAALAIGTDRLCIDLQPDGDFLFHPAGLWTLANLEIPLLIIMNNNRQYKNSTDHASRIAKQRGRSTAARHIGTSLRDPDIDYATVAKGFGIWAHGPVEKPAELSTALKAAIKVVRSGKPALLDVVTTGS